MTRSALVGGICLFLCAGALACGDTNQGGEVRAEPEPDVGVGEDVDVVDEVDEISPLVEIASPEDNSVVEGLVRVVVIATDDVGVAEVIIKLDGEVEAILSSEPFEGTLDLSDAAPGEYEVEATASDEAGNIAVDTITLIIEAPDEPPVVEFLSPVDGQTLSDQVEISAGFDDDGGVVGVDFFVDGGLLLEDRMVPFGTVWDTTQFDDGVHTLRAVAIDTAMQEGEATIEVTLDNTSPQLEISSPAEGELVRETLGVVIEAEDVHGVESVRLQIGEDIDVEIEAEPFEASLDVSGLALGEATLRVTATDSVGNIGEASVNFVVDGLPTVELLLCDFGCRPIEEGQRVAGNVVLLAEAQDDNNEIVSVAFLIDGEAAAVLGEAPFEFVWDTTEEVFGEHSIEVIATNLDGEEARDSASVEVVDRENDEIFRCIDACFSFIFCPEVIDLCGEDIAAEVNAECAQSCEDEEGRGQILAAEGLSCEVIAPLVIDGFGLNERCSEPEERCFSVGAACDPEVTEDGFGLSCVRGTDTTDPEAASCLLTCEVNPDNTDCPSGSFCAELELGNPVCVLSNCTDPLTIEECESVGLNGGTCLPAANDSFYCFVAGERQEGEACGGQDSCGPGLVCPDQVCEPVCVNGEEGQCGEGERRDCLPLLNSDIFGVCGDSCPGFQTIDECPEGEGCLPLRDGLGTCRPVGETPLGSPCTEADECEAFTQCQQLENGQASLCRQMCDRSEGFGDEHCSEGEICLENTDAFGTCFDGCEPLEAEDENGCTEEGARTCVPIEDPFRGVCLSSGDRQIGESCDLINGSVFGDCVGNAMCVRELDEGVCQPICRVFSSVNEYESGCGPEEVCELFSEAFGVCSDNVAEPRIDAFEPCPEAGQWCSDDVLCLQVDQQQNNLCIPVCRLAQGDNDCPGEGHCEELLQSDVLGLCLLD